MCCGLSLPRSTSTILSCGNMRVFPEWLWYFRLRGTCCPLQVSCYSRLLTGGKTGRCHGRKTTTDPPKVHERLWEWQPFRFASPNWEQVLQQCLTKRHLSKIYMNLNTSSHASHKSPDQILWSTGSYSYVNVFSIFGWIFKMFHHVFLKFIRM